MRTSSLSARFVFALLLAASCARGHVIVTPISAVADQLAVFGADGRAVDALRAIEDARPTSPDSIAILQRALGAPSLHVRRFAARALGRLERPDQIDALARALADGSPAVRSEAANAIAQAASRGGPPAMAHARDVLAARIGLETDDGARAMLAESLGRVAAPPLPPDSTARLILAIAGPHPSTTVLRGTVRGLYFLATKGQARATTAYPFLAAAATSRAPASDTTRFIRTLALATLAASGAPADQAVLSALTDSSELVRERAVAAASFLRDTAVSHAVLEKAARLDPSALVRFRALQLYQNRYRATDGCGVLARAAAVDPSVTVAIAAIDAMARCPDSVTALTLEVFARELPPGDAAPWHKAAHATVALAQAAPSRARPLIPRLAAHANELARAYAAQAAQRVGDTATLRKLIHDSRPNVVTAAIDGLARPSAPTGLTRHADDASYIAALASNDNQVLMRAAAALSGTTDTRAVPAMLAALARLTALDRETTRDGRVALLERIGELAKPSDAGALRSLLADADSLVANRAAAIVGRWTGSRPAAMPRPHPIVPVPTSAELAELARLRAFIEMADGSTIEMRLFPFDAPTNVARFVRLARAGKFDGLTFHRVAPFFVVQGLSPNANEYSAPDGPFTRDELGRENLRGTVGLSTRGRDTGDGQIYFNLVDNVRLDHDYTVFGEVVAGWAAVERMQEGARIRRVTIR